MEHVKGILPTYSNVTKTVKLKGKDVKIHGLCTGSVAVKSNFRKKKGVGPLAKLNIIFDKTFTNYLPIWVWVIEHPDGLIVIDTGENTGITDLDNYLQKETWFLRFQFKNAAKFQIQECQELNHQFATVNLNIHDVKLVALTHLHLDHTDGLKFFPKQEILVGAFEYKYAQSNMPSTYPHWFKPNRVTYQNNKIEIFNQAYPITQSEDLLYIPTPGHTMGHSSILFKTDNFDILFSGDTSYNQQQVIMNEAAGVNADYKLTAKTYKNIIDYSRLRKTIYLPTHDENSGQRLLSNTFLF